MKIPFKVDLTGKTAIVTGGSGTLCSAMAYGLAVSGAKVAIIGRNKDKLNNVTDELINNAKTEYSKDIVVKGYSCNVIDKEELNKSYEIIKSELGSCDIRYQRSWRQSAGCYYINRDVKERKRRK